MTAQTGHATAEQFYEIKGPTGKKFPPPKGRCWGYAEATVRKLIDEKRVWFGKTGKSRPRLKRFLSEAEGVAAWTWWSNTDAGHNQEAKQELIQILGPDVPFDTPKPTRLIRRIIQLATDNDSIVLDSFAGSGTTRHAVLAQNKEDNGSRRFVLVEMDDKISDKVTSERLKRVIEGYRSRSSESGEWVEGIGGGFRYCPLADPLFDETGYVCKAVSYSDLARHVFFAETGEPLPKATNGKRSPLIGVCNGTAYYLLFNGVMGDKSPDGGNVLTGEVLRKLPKHNGPRVVFGEGCRLGRARLKRDGVTFKQIPYEIKVS